MSSEAEIRKRKIYRVTFVGFVVNLVLCARETCRRNRRDGAERWWPTPSIRCSDLATDVVVIAFARISGQAPGRRPRLRPREVRNARHDHHKPRAGGSWGPGFLPSSIRDIRIVVDGGLLPRPGAGGPRGRPGCRSSSRRFSTATRSREGRAGRQPERRGQCLASPQRRPFVAGDARRHRLRLFPGPEVAHRRPHRGARRGGVHLQGGLRSDPHGAGRTAGAFAVRPMWRRRFCAIVTADPEVCQPHNLRTRRIGAAIAVEVHVRVDGAMTVGALARADGRHRTPPARPLRRGHDDRHSCRAAANSRRSANRSQRPSNSQVRRSVLPVRPENRTRVCLLARFSGSHVPVFDVSPRTQILPDSCVRNINVPERHSPYADC